jgi:hypothetical protein
MKVKGEKFKDAWSKTSYMGRERKKKKVFSIFYVDKHAETNSIKAESILKDHNASLSLLASY